MNKKRMWISSRVVFVGLLATIVLAAEGVGCAGAWPSQLSADDQTPFPDDRVPTLSIVMEEEDWDFCLTHPFEEQYVPADFWFDDERIPSVGVRPKGNSSLGQAIGWGSPRIPLAVDFNLFNRARSFYGIKKIFLNNGWSDPTLIRERVAYELFEQMGLPTPRSAHVDVWVNDIHLGVYTMVEAIDATFLARHFKVADGNLYKPELVAARLDWTEADINRSLLSPFFSEPPPPHHPALYTNIGGAPFIALLRALGQEELVSIYEPIPSLEGNFYRGLPPVRQSANYLEAVALKTNENNPDHSALFRFLEVLNKEPNETFPEEIEKVLDVDQVLRFFAVSAVILHLDNYIGVGHNNYIYEANGVFTLIPWDLNMAFGTFNCGIDREGLVNYYIDEPTSARMDRFPLVNRLLSHPPYLEIYRGYVQEMIDGPFQPDVVIARIDHFANLIRTYIEADTEKFYATKDCIRCLDEDLRPEDVFIGWQAGGAVPQIPWPSRLELKCLQKHFDINALFDLWRHELKPEDLEKVESCLSEEKYDTFLLAFFGPMKSPQLPGQPGVGPNSHGLKPFVIDRYESVRQQLSGERPSAPDIKGSGNGVTRGMCAGGF